MMNSGTMADMLREAMEKKQGGKNSFTMTGQYTSPVQRDGDREFVVYESPNGEEVKVYGNWNEYAVSQDEEGRMMIADEDYPIVENAEGEFVLDEETFEGQMKGAEMGQGAEGGPGESKMQDLMEKLSQARGEGGAPAPGMAKGGKIYARGGYISGGGGGGEADSDDALIVDGKYSPFIKRYMNGGKLSKDDPKLPPERFYARPEAVNPSDPDSPMTVGFYDEGRKVTSQDFARALESAGEGGHIQDYVKSGMKNMPRFDRASGSWAYTSQDPRTRRFEEQRRARN